ncbi:uncharacterized protein LOC117297031 [Asterias rubens]|uniref:uncharacterized protein LOC117297031 n=1 Tax=Asterias rubens TaxID=7604 RepID=UPI001454F933|nr:uncharacterized protein LOC117297031 [Asterias rubens]
MDACEFKHLYCTAALLAACVVSCAFAQTETPDVTFTRKPKDLFEYFTEADESLVAPVLNCQIRGLTDEMEVEWLRNDLAIHEGEYTAKNYSLLSNYTDSDFDLEISRNITLRDDRDKYCCAVYVVANISQSHERTLFKKMCARVKVYFFARERNPECLISVTSPEAAYKEGTGFTLECCINSWNLHIQLLWERNRNNGFRPIMGMNISRKNENALRKCIVQDMTDHQEGDTYQCLTTISQFSLTRANRQLQQIGVDLNSVRQKSCTFAERSTILVSHDDHKEDDPTFSCYSPGANYIWSFVPNLDEKNQYHMSKDRSTVLLNLDTLTDTEYNITCTAVGEDSIGSKTLNVEISPVESTMQNVFKIVAISLGVIVVLFFILLIVYFVKTRLSFVCGRENRSRNLTPQEMRARIQIRRNMSGNSSGLYAFPSSRMASSSITPLMEGPEEGASSAEQSSPKPPRPGLIPDRHRLEGAVGGAILDEDDMIECEYRDEFEPDPKSMNVEGLQYADLEFSSDEEEYAVEDEEEASETTGDDKGEKPKVNYADIVHFDPRRNSDPRRKSTST